MKRPLPTYEEFISRPRIGSWAQVLCFRCNMHRQWRRVHDAFRRNLENGMIEPEAAYHALVNDEDA